MMLVRRDTPTMTPIACPTDRPNASKLEPTVHAVVLTPHKESEGEQPYDIVTSTCDDPISCKPLPCPRPSFVRDGNKVTVSPEIILIVCVLVNWTFQPFGPKSSGFSVRVGPHSYDDSSTKGMEVNGIVSPQRDGFIQIDSDNQKKHLSRAVTLLEEEKKPFMTNTKDVYKPASCIKGFEKG